MKKLIVAIFLFSAFSGIAENKLDSIYKEWQNKKNSDSVRVAALAVFIRDGMLFTKPDSAYTLSKSLLQFSNKHNMETGKADALNFMGVSKTLIGNYQIALEYFEKSLDITNKIKDRKRKSVSLANIAVIYDNMGDYSKALEYNNWNIKNSEELGDTNGLLRCYNNIGIIYDNMGDNIRALEYYSECLKLSKEVKNNRGIASSLINIGMILSDQKHYKKAKEYIEKSLLHSELAKDPSNIANAYNNLGYIFGEQGKYDQAFDFYNRGLKKYIEINEKKGVASSLFSLGDLKLNQKLYNDALWYFNESLELYEELELSLDLANNLNKNGKSYLALGQISKAIKNCKRGFEISKKIGAIEVEKESCECLYDLYKKKGDTKNALLYHERMKVLGDSVKFEETSKKLLMMEFKKQLTADSLEKEKEKLETKLEYQELLAEENNIRNIAVGSGILLLMIVGGLYTRMRYIRGSRTEAEYEKDRSNNLLLNILPAEIAEELKEKGKSEARNFDNVSILFTDFKEFTQTSEKLSAKELVEEINVCFEFFDSVCDKYNIEKIKTIGDSYMAAGGLPIPKLESTKNTILAALEMCDFIKKREHILLAKDKLPFQMRVGISTGPVVAGIVGTKKFQYDIWGDTVNTASRMETAGEVGRVNVSQFTYKMLKEDPDFIFAPRGKIEAKGKGEIDMYFVERTTK